MIRQTSLMAYQDITEDKKLLNYRYNQIINIIHNSYGMTDREIADKLGYKDPNKIRPRRNELMKKGIIIDCGKRPCRITGKFVHFWRTPASDGAEFPMEIFVK